MQLKDFANDGRRRRSRRKAIVGQLFGAFSQITGANGDSVPAAGDQRLGQFGGFTYELLDQSGGPIESLDGGRAAADGARQTRRRASPVCSRSSRRTIRSSSSTIDREQAKSLGMSLSDVTGHHADRCSARPTSTTSTSTTGRIASTCRPTSQFRAAPSDIERVSRADVVGPDDAAQQRSSRSRETTAPKIITHYNLFRVGRDQRIGGAGLQLGAGAADHGAAVEPGAAAGHVVRVVRRLARGDRRRAASRSTIFGLGLLLVYLTLAGQYESLTLPFIILLSVPLAIMGALAAQWGRGLDRRRLLPDRPRDADRPVGEERHSRSWSSRSSCARAG